MQNILIISLCLMTLNLTAQDSEVIVKKDKSKKQFLEYEVLKGSNEIKNGDYKEYYYPFLGLPMFAKHVKIDGKYYNNLRDGIWTLYSKSGEKHMQVDYTKYKIIYKSPIILNDEKANSKSYTDIDLSFGRANDTQPDFETGFPFYYEYIAKNIQKELCPKDTSEIRVYVKFHVKEDGTLERIEVSQSGGEDYDKEALRLIKNSEGMWIPGNNNENKRIEVGVIFKNYE